MFRQPALQHLTVSAITSVLGISPPYAADIRKDDVDRIRGIGRFWHRIAKRYDKWHREVRVYALHPSGRQEHRAPAK